MPYGERLFNGRIFAFYAHGKTKSDARKIVEILKKQNRPDMKYRIEKQKYRYGVHYAVYIA